MEKIIEVKNLKKVYGSKGITYTALDGINLEVEKGEFLGVMGASGAGKTTLLNILSTIDMQTSGDVIFKGQDLKKMDNKNLAKFRRDNIGFIFQDFNLLDNMTVQDNIALPLALNNVNYKNIEKRVFKISSFFGIDMQLKKYPYQLSGGQKQRTAAARALITNPEVIFGDEPTGALDSKSSAELLERLTDMNREFKTTVIMVTHDAFAASYCKKVIFIKDGKIYARLDKNATRKEFFKRILDLIAAAGGSQNELF